MKRFLIVGITVNGDNADLVIDAKSALQATCLYFAKVAELEWDIDPDQKVRVWQFPEPGTEARVLMWDKDVEDVTGG